MMDFDRRRLMQGATLALLASSSAATNLRAQGRESWFPLKGDDGKPTVNTRLPIELTSEIELLPGVIWVGSNSTAVTLYEFYDYNCPYCRAAAKDLHKLLETKPELRLGLINNAILSLGSVQAAKVEAALLLLKGRAAAYAFHRRLFSPPGVKDGPRALDLVESMGVSRARIETIADSDEVAGMLSEQTKLAANLGLAATPSFVAGGAGVLGYPGPRTLARIIASLDECGEIVCRS